MKELFPAHGASQGNTYYVLHVAVLGRMTRSSANQYIYMVAWRPYYAVLHLSLPQSIRRLGINTLQSPECRGSGRRKRVSLLPVKS